MSEAAAGRVPEISLDELLSEFPVGRREHFASYTAIVDAGDAASGGKKGHIDASSCFQILGADIILTDNGEPRLLEMNGNPSLGVDTVFPVEGPHARTPPEPTAEQEAIISPARPHVMHGLRGKPCRCREHHRRHVHTPCAVDLLAKGAAIEAVLEFAHRTLRSGEISGGVRMSTEELLEGIPGVEQLF